MSSAPYYRAGTITAKTVGSGLPNPLNVKGPEGRVRQVIATENTMRKYHMQRRGWWRTRIRNSIPYYGIWRHEDVPRILLQRNFINGQHWSEKKNLPDEARWERVINGMRWSEDRYSLVEEDGQMHKVNWKLYSDRVNAELHAMVEHMPSFSMKFTGVPANWRWLDIALQRVAGLSMREALAQTKLEWGTNNVILFHLLEMVQQGAENKGLDKEKLRLSFSTVWFGSRDKAIHLRSRGYYSWRTIKSSKVILVVTEDPEMELPDRTVLPFRSQLALRKAGIDSEITVLDVPAITADGI